MVGSEIELRLARGNSELIQSVVEMLASDNQLASIGVGGYPALTTPVPRFVAEDCSFASFFAKL